MDDWHKVETLFRAALELPAAQRQDWLQQACGGDAELLHEVGSLLDNHREDNHSQHWAAAAAAQLIAAAASLQPGCRLGPYEIDTPIGAGGMGEVYRARDTTLNRDVALKILPRSFGQDSDRLARLSREAQLLASLNHPNIAAIYGVQERALVMELVEGLTLAERTATGPMPLEEVLDIARQISEALEYAHEKGIIHRDLKPANIKVTPQGRVKLLDFGLAKVLDSGPAAGNPASSPTAIMTATGDGVILGTAAYMAPEQARGLAVDKRADIWSFGVILYEITCGRPLFQRNTISDTLAAVLREEPEWDRIPIQVRRLLRQCLEKDRKRRLRDIGDVWFLIDDAVPAQAASSRFSWTAWIACAFFVVISVALAFTRFRQAAPALEPVSFRIEPPENVRNVGAVGISPDGRYVAFAAVRDGIPRLWLRSLGSLEASPVAGSEGISPGAPPAWSPDGRFIAFIDAGGTRLRRISVSGGIPQTICELPGGGGWTGFWSPDGRIVFGRLRGTLAPGLLQVQATGGVPSPITSVDRSRGETQHDFPILLPDGRRFLYQRRSIRPEFSGIYVGTLDAQPAEQSSKRLLPDMSNMAYVSSSGDSHPGSLLFVREGVLVAQPFDAIKLALAGDAIPVVKDVSVLDFGHDVRYGDFSASTSGALAYRTGEGARTNQLVWFDRAGKRLGTLGEPGEYRCLRFSPEGSQLALERRTLATGWDIWVLDPLRGVGTRLTSDRSDEIHPVWSPDGKRVAYFSKGRLFEKAASGTATESPLADVDTPAHDWSLDGRFLLLWRLDPQTSGDLWAAALDGDRKPFPVVRTPYTESHGQFSPDRRWVAYRSDESGRPEIYVQPFPPSASDGRRLVSEGGGIQPRWSRDGKELFYVSGDRKLMSVRITATLSSKQPVMRTEPPVPLFAAPIDGSGRSLFYVWDVTPDGQKFLFDTLLSRSNIAPIYVILNWRATLQGRNGLPGSARSNRHSLQRLEERD